ncbi:FAD-dependent monooxygenase [Streptomonospora nanhaiensis]|uniref:FAD-dependent monooxygenase n=1 Tax=Streptomonospora nanhaiensis TaxID=1323731 RepID=UPI001C9963EC|nr:FAD-dependent monooxygenase [Streptomonospora nanhaiensis]MBX9388057.1 FAD-dependent monooxygenase [Streptomonospora nanhaiensis]
MDERNGGGRRALVVGLGVSGISAALRLRQIGWTPVVVERAAARRTGGYFVALFGAGRAAAGRLGALEHMTDRGPDGASHDIDRDGGVRPGLGFKDFPGRPWLMTRGDVEAAAFAALPADVEVRYSTEPVRIEQDAEGVEVTLADTAAQTSATERFDLVVGADGLRSTVRRLVFGPHEDHLHRMGHMAVAFQLPGALPGFSPRDSVIMAESARSMWVFPFKDGPPTVLLSYRTDDVDAEFTRPMAERVREAFGPEPPGPVLGAALDALESAPDVLFDSVEQVRMDRWHRGRVVLVGDAAWCVTLYAGMGVSSGMAGADLLGTMLQRHGADVPEALARWERRLRPHIAYLQGNGTQMRAFFVPAGRFELGRRRLLLRLSLLPLTEPLFRMWRTKAKAARMKDMDFAHPDLATAATARAARVPG